MRSGNMLFAEKKSFSRLLHVPARRHERIDPRPSSSKPCRVVIFFSSVIAFSVKARRNLEGSPDFFNERLCPGPQPLPPVFGHLQSPEVQVKKVGKVARGGTACCPRSPLCAFFSHIGEFVTLGGGGGGQKKLFLPVFDNGDGAPAMFSAAPCNYLPTDITPSRNALSRSGSRPNSCLFCSDQRERVWSSRAARGESWADWAGVSLLRSAAQADAMGPIQIPGRQTQRTHA